MGFKSKALSSQGVHISVQFGVAATLALTAITAANPAVATKTGHGLNAGDVGALSAVTDVPSLNGVSAAIKKLTADTFQLVGVDNTVGNGGAVADDGIFTPYTFANLCEAKTFQGFDGSSNEIDVTTLCSEAKEYRLGLQDFGSFTFEMNLVPDDPGSVALEAAKASGAPLWFTVDIPDGLGDMAGSYVFQAYVKSKSISGGVDAALSTSVSLRITGAPVYVAYV